MVKHRINVDLLSHCEPYSTSYIHKTNSIYMYLQNVQESFLTKTVSVFEEGVFREGSGQISLNLTLKWRHFLRIEGGREGGREGERERERVISF